ncbi:hypothetical protein BGZ83_011139 [Gryganskiella cystojenkinii]|nr:hypothetical protein BGZ83_011139 [Gryganskiella cystojenkinii]
MTALTLTTPASSASSQQQMYAIQHNQKQRAHQLHHQLQLQQHHMQQQQQMYHQQLIHQQHQHSPSPSLSQQHTHVQHFQPCSSAYTSTTVSLEDMEPNHHLAILGDHAASPQTNFMELPNTSNNSNNFDSSEPMVEYQQQQQMLQQHIAAQHHHIQQNEYAMSSPPLPSSHKGETEYQFFPSQPSTEQQFNNTHYMITAMARSLSDSEISEICEATAASATSVAATAAAQMSPSLYNQQHHVHYQHYSNGFRPTHSYANSISNLSEVSSVSSSSSMSPCELARTFSQPSMSLTEDYGSMEMIHPLRASASTTSTNSLASIESSPSNSVKRESSEGATTLKSPKRSRGRRVSSQLDPDSCFTVAAAGGKVFTCEHLDCGKIFKRSEHLKRHYRSIHTLEKPFECPIEDCTKRFSRSDNLNQHIRIHRHANKSAMHDHNKSKTVSAFTPFLVAYSDSL